MLGDFMKIGIVSDTHGCIETWNETFNRFFYDTDLIIHAGDVLYHGPRNAIPPEYNPKDLATAINHCPVPLVIASGNCDSEVDSMVLEVPIQAPYAYVMINGMRFIVNHGHNLSEQQKLSLASRYRVKLFITGHTHIASLEEINGTVFLNPGSPSMSKMPNGVKTIALLEDNSLDVLDIETGKVILSHSLD